MVCHICSRLLFLFKHKFTEEQRKSGPTNFVMGLSFITEGAIPFAASDPLMYLVALVAGTVVSALVLGAIKKPVVEM